MKTLIKIISIFVIFFSIIVIKGCFLVPNLHTECYSCEITDFEVLAPWKENDTLLYTDIVWSFDAQDFWDCIQTTCQINTNLIKSACAHDVDYQPNGEIKSINVFSNADYDSIHPAGSSLNDIFILYANYVNLGKIDDYISQIQFPVKTYRILRFGLSKNTPPDSIRLQQFTVVYEEIDSTIIEKTLPAVYILPN